MFEILMQSPIVSCIQEGRHDDVSLHFAILSDMVIEEFSSPEDWAVKNALMYKFIAMLELMANKSCPKCTEGIAIIKSCFMSIRDSFSPGNQPMALAPIDCHTATVARNDEKANIAIVEAVEFINSCHCNIFPFMTKTRVKEKANEFLGTNITDRQMTSNYANIKCRKGDMMATYMQQMANNLNTQLQRESVQDDNRRK